jgi:hypothetical protein
MSWHFSRALAEAYSLAPCSDGKLSAQLKLSPTQSGFSSEDRMKDFSRLSQFGMIFAPLKESLGAALLTSFLAAFPASRSVQPRTVTPLRLTCGTRCDELLTKSVRTSYLPKMSQLKQSPEPPQSCDVTVTYPKSLIFRRETWAQTILGTDRGVLLPRPTCAANFLAPSMYKHDSCRNFIRVFGLRRPRGENGLSLLQMPTRGTGSLRLKEAKDGERQDKWWVQWPYEIGQHPRPNPLDLEWMMGWPTGWTDISSSATVKFQQWQQQHFSSSQTNLKENLMENRETFIDESGLKRFKDSNRKVPVRKHTEPEILQSPRQLVIAEIDAKIAALQSAKSALLQLL